MADFKLHLSSELITERKTVSYRTLARSQKVHVNTAKCMLYEFYEEQKKRKPGSVYATYLLSGVKKQEQQKKDVDQDVSMRSSPPPPSSSMPQSQSQSESQQEEIRVRTITLVREESLVDVKNTYETISSIHIYSLSAVKIPDLMTLSDLTRSLYTDVFAKEDPLSHNKTYGVIQNPQVRRRKGKRPAAVTAQPKFQPVQEKAKPKPIEKAVPKEAEKATPTLKKENSLSKPSSRESTPKPSLKRDTSDIFKSFAKAKAKPKDVPDTDDGDEDETLFESKPTSTKRTSEVKKERDDKAAKLRKMMDSDDEDAATPTSTAEAPASKVPVEDKGEEEDEEMAWSESDTEKPKLQTKPTAEPVPEPEPPADTGPKRKRGKRKVMRKRTAKDADGYLVTKEEEAWESFSESDNEPAKPALQEKKTFGGFPKKPIAPKKAAPASSGGKKDIASFFKKK